MKSIDTYGTWLLHNTPRNSLVLEFVFAHWSHWILMKLLSGSGDNSSLINSMSGTVFVIKQLRAKPSSLQQLVPIEQYILSIVANICTQVMVELSFACDGLPISQTSPQWDSWTFLWASEFLMDFGHE